MTTEDDKTRVRAAPFRDPSDETVHLYAEMGMLAEEVGVRHLKVRSRPIGRNNVLLVGTVWFAGLIIFTAAIPAVISFFGIGTLTLIFMLSAAYVVAGLRSIVYCTNKPNQKTFRQYLTRIRSSETAYIRAMIASCLLSLVLGVALPIPWGILLFLFPALQIFIGINWERRREVIEALQELDTIDALQEQIFQKTMRLQRIEHPEEDLAEAEVAATAPNIARAKP